MTCLGCESPARVALTCEYLVRGVWTPSHTEEEGPKLLCCACADAHLKPSADMGTRRLITAWRVTVEGLPR